MRKDIRETLRDFRHRPGLKNLMTYLMFVVLATIIWCGRALRTVHDATLPVTIEYIGVPTNVSWQQDLPHTLRAEVRDAGTRLRVYRYKPITITLDLRGQFARRSGTVRISANQLRTQILANLQGTSKLIAVIPDHIEGTYATQKQKRVPIRLHHDIQCAAEYKLLREPTLQPEYVTIYGTQSQLDSIRYIETAPLQLQDIKESGDYTVSLLTHSTIHTDIDQVSVHIDVDRITERVVSLTLQSDGVPDDKTMRLFPQKVDVTLCVPVNDWNLVSDSDVVAYCRYSEQEEQNKLPVELRYSNPHISSARVYPSSVEFIIENK